MGLGVSGGITALLLILLAAAAAGGSSGQNTGATTLTTGYFRIYPNTLNKLSKVLLLSLSVYTYNILAYILVLNMS